MAKFVAYIFVLKVEKFIKNFEKTATCVDTTLSLTKKPWDCEKGIGTGDKPLRTRIIRKFVLLNS